MNERTYTCVDCGRTLPCERPKGRKPERCPEHAVARGYVVKRAWDAKRAEAGAPPQALATDEEALRQRYRDRARAGWRSRRTTQARTYVCSECGATEEAPSYGLLPTRCPAHRRTARREYNREYSIAWRERNPEAVKRAKRAHYERNIEQERARARASERTRNSWKSATRTETIERYEVFYRDNWTCGLCHEPVDKTLRWPHPQSPSVDHIVPLSKGGTHTYDNLQCTHLVCNVGKGTQ